MAPEIAASKSVGLPFGFAEFGLSTATGRPAWLTEVGNYLMQSGALFATLFNGCAQYPTLKLTDAASVAVWKSFVAKSGTDVPRRPHHRTPRRHRHRHQPPRPRPRPPHRHPHAHAEPDRHGDAAADDANNPVVNGLALSPAAFTGSGTYAAITFSLSQASDVTILVLDAKGTVVRTLTKPARAAGKVAIRYYGFDGPGHHEPPGITRSWSWPATPTAAGRRNRRCRSALRELRRPGPGRKCRGRAAAESGRLPASGGCPARRAAPIARPSWFCYLVFTALTRYSGRLCAGKPRQALSSTGLRRPG